MSALAAGIGIREFARRDGCSEKLVREAVKKGRLTALPDGTLDPALVGTGWRKSARTGSGGYGIAMGYGVAGAYGSKLPTGAETADSPQGIRSAAAEVSAVATQLASVLGIEPGDFMRDVLAGNFSDIAKAEQVKENALALKHLLDGRQRAGDLVERDVAETVLFETSRAARDAWLNWPVRVGPLLAADLGLDAQKVTEALIPYVQQQLEALGEPDADFTDQRS